MKNYKHLNAFQRQKIELLLNQDMKLIDIAHHLDYNPRTISMMGKTGFESVNQKGMELQKKNIAS